MTVNLQWRTTFSSLVSVWRKQNSGSDEQSEHNFWVTIENPCAVFLNEFYAHFWRLVRCEITNKKQIHTVPSNAGAKTTRKRRAIQFSSRPENCAIFSQSGLARQTFLLATKKWSHCRNWRNPSGVVFHTQTSAAEVLQPRLCIAFPSLILLAFGTTFWRLVRIPRNTARWSRHFRLQNRSHRTRFFKIETETVCHRCGWLGGGAIVYCSLSDTQHVIIQVKTTTRLTRHS